MEVLGLGTFLDMLRHRGYYPASAPPPLSSLVSSNARLAACANGSFDPIVGL